MADVHPASMEQRSKVRRSKARKQKGGKYAVPGASSVSPSFLPQLSGPAGVVTRP
jgi:hypothetical protein